MCNVRFLETQLNHNIISQKIWFDGLMIERLRSMFGCAPLAAHELVRHPLFLKRKQFGRIFGLKSKKMYQHP